MTCTFGKKLKLTIFGESHGPSIGCILDGLPSGLVLDPADLSREMRRRAPGQNSLSTARQEKDDFSIESGLFEGKTTGTPLCARIANKDTHSSDYEELRTVMRPGHADYPAHVKYGGYNDFRGGGSFSGRLTAPLVLAGAIAKQYLFLRGIVVGAHIASIGYVEDSVFEPLGETAALLLGLATKEFPVLSDDRGETMKKVILAAKEQKDSVGGTVECMAVGIPAGLGSPFFDSLESVLAHMLFAVPAVKAVEFGQGFAMTELCGSQVNDALYISNGAIRAKSNNNGGITGGITNGMPVVFKVGIKPTPSIGRAQETINVATGENTVIAIKGRHDPCIVPRAVPVIEAVCAWTILDMLLDSDIRG